MFLSLKGKQKDINPQDKRRLITAEWESEKMITKKNRVAWKRKVRHQKTKCSRANQERLVDFVCL